MYPCRLVLILLLLPWPLPAASLRCYGPLATLREWAWPKVRQAEQALLLAEKARWDEVVLPHGEAGLQLILDRLGQPNTRVSAESLLALLDKLTPMAQRSFEGILAALKSQGVTVQFRATPRDREVNYRGPRWRWVFEGKRPHLRKTLQLDVTERPVTSAEDLYQRLYGLSVVLGSLPMNRLSAKSSWLPTYRQLLTEAIRASDERVYATIHGWETQFGKSPKELVDKDVPNWMLGYYGVPLRLLPSLLFFGYHPTKGHVPNKEGYRLYKKGAEEGWDHLLGISLEKRFGPRAVTKYAADTYGRTIRVVALAGIAVAMKQLYQQLTSGEFLDELKDSATIMGIMLDPTLGTEEGTKPTEASPAVVLYFEQKISACEEEIAKHGLTDARANELAFYRAEQAHHVGKYSNEPLPETVGKTEMGDNF